MIYDNEGGRKYLTIKERNAFLAAAKELPLGPKTFCLTLAYTGARISEVLALTYFHVDTEAETLVLQSLKKRRVGSFRAVPVPIELLEQLAEMRAVSANNAAKDRIWPWCRTTAWSLVKRTMADAGIFEQSRAMPKALRHAFGVGAIQAKVPLSTLQKWMGHSRASTTAIYTDVVGEEERQLARWVWSHYLC